MPTITIIDHSGDVIRIKDEAVARALEGVGLFLEGEAADELENYPRRVDTGRLKGSIAHDVSVPDKILTVGTNVEYGIYIHEGTRRMAPNRFLKNAFTRNTDQIKNYILTELKRG